MQPVETDEFIFFRLQHFCLFDRPIPGEAEYGIPFIYLIGKPLLQSGRGRQEIIQNAWGTSYGVLYGK